MPLSTATPVSGDLLGEKYRLERLIGEGGMGCVFEALNVLTDRRVAVKWLKPELAANPSTLQRFLREARLTSRIEHPNVVQIYDVAKHGDAYFLVMELLHGESLAHAVANRDLSVREAIDTLIAVMRGVAEAHASGVIHRDLKPDNIFLCVDRRGERREPKVLDFGISKLQQQETLDTTTAKMTREGQMLGTPYYMSPEQLEASPNIDARADVYALGVILYEVLTRRVPFEADTLTGIMMRIIESNPRPPSELRSELPPALDAIVLKAMARHAHQRFASVQELAVALEPFGTVRFSSRTDSGGIHSLPYMNTVPQTPTPMSTGDAVKVPSRNGSRALWIGLAVAVLGVFGWWLATRSTGEVAREAPPVVAEPESHAAGEPRATSAPAPVAPVVPAAAPAAQPEAEAPAAEPVVAEPTPAPEPVAPSAAAPAAAREPQAPAAARPARPARRRPEAASVPAVATPEPVEPPAPAKKPKASKAAPALVDF